MRLRAYCAAVFLSCLTLLPWGRAQEPVEPALDAAAPLGQALFERSGTTGMVLVVVRGREVLFRGYGQTAPGSGQAPGPASLLRLCSLSKIFATDLLIKLAMAGKVRLDDTLERFAPAGVTVPQRGGRAITLGDLATHTSGLPREVGPAPAGTPHFTFPDYRYRWGWLPAQSLRSVPGMAAVYSNVGFDLLGDALEAAAQMPYARLLVERTTGPLGMRETTFTPSAIECARLLQGAHEQGPCTDTQNSAGSSGVYSTASDMARWLEYLLGTDTPAIPAQNPAAQAVYLDPATLRRVQGLDHAGRPSGIGLGWMHLGGEGQPQSITEKTGGGAGFLTYIALNRANRTAIFLAATDGPVDTRVHLFREANNLLLTMEGLPPLPPDPVTVPRAAVKTKKRVKR